MFIRIEEDILKCVVEEATKGDNNDITNAPATRCLTECVTAIMRGKHYIYIPEWIKYRDKLKTILPSYVYNVLQGLSRQDGHALDIVISNKLVVTEDDKARDGIMIYSPSCNRTLEIFEESHLICENLNDANFYEYIQMYYRHQCISKLDKRSHCCLFKRNGGGSTIDKVIEKESNLGQHLFFVVADSDYKYCLIDKSGKKEQKYKGAKGETANKILTVMKKVKKKHPFANYHIMDEVREIENLIPSKVLAKAHPQNDELAKRFICSKDYSYFDVKTGLSVRELLDDKSFNYWTDLLAEDDIDKDFVSKIREKYNSKGEYDDAYKSLENDEKSKHKLIIGWGDKILDNILSKRELSELLENISPNDLSDSQKKEWSEIGKCLFEWGYASIPRMT